MTYALWALMILFAFIIQGRVSFFDVNPNFTIVLAYYAGIREGAAKGLMIGSVIGAIEDSLSGSLLGPHLLSKGLVGYFSSFIAGRFFRWTPLMGIIGISILTVFDSGLVFVSRSFFDRMPASLGASLFVIAIHPLFNAPLGLVLRPKVVE